jgi:hypothetical protein
LFLQLNFRSINWRLDVYLDFFRCHCLSLSTNVVVTSFAQEEAQEDSDELKDGDKTEE